jgi:5'-nucleotidase
VTLPPLPDGSGDIAGEAPKVEAPAEAAPAPAEPAKPAEPAPAPAEPAKPAEAAPAPAEPAKPAEAAPGTHVVVAGDTYWDLAKKYYGDANKWHLIADANAGLPPKRLPIGVTLTIPPAN